MTVTELAPLVEAREVSPVEILDAQLQRIGELDPVLRAFIHVSEDEARATARAAEVEIAAGVHRGPMHGMTIGYKDILDVRGMATTGASRLLPDNIAAQDATVVGRIRAAGGVCLGKLNLVEFASGNMEVYGFARSPWNLAATPGGSSSGSGVAVAAGMVTVALGTDTGGSVRTPACYGGLVGLRPTYGRVSRAGCLPLSWSQDSIGPMARSVSDVAILLGIMAGPDRRDTTAAARPVPEFTAGLGGDLTGVRVGVPDSFFMDDLDPEIGAAMVAALGVLTDLGAQIHPVSLPASRYASSASWTVAYSESYTWHRDWFATRSREYTAPFLHKITAAALMSADEFHASQQVRQVVSAEVLGAFDHVDVIVTPTTRALASSPASASTAWSGEMASVLRPFSLAGTPALSVPIGFAADNTPMGMQVVARPWDEAEVLRVGHAYERAAGWHRARPGPIPAELPPRYGTGPTAPPAPTGHHHPTFTPEWVLRLAQVQGMDFVTEADAEVIAPMVAVVKDQLATARQDLDLSVEPPTRPAYG